MSRYRNELTMSRAARHYGVTVDELRDHIRADEWHCGMCRTWLPATAFRGNKHARCVACDRKSNALYMRRRYRGVKSERRINRRCDWCGCYSYDTKPIDGSPICPDCVPKVEAGERPQDKEVFNGLD